MSLFVQSYFNHSLLKSKQSFDLRRFKVYFVNVFGSIWTQIIDRFPVDSVEYPSVFSVRLNLCTVCVKIKWIQNIIGDMIINASVAVIYFCWIPWMCVWERERKLYSGLGGIELYSVCHLCALVRLLDNDIKVLIVLPPSASSAINKHCF